MDCDWKAGADWTMKYPDGRIADSGSIIEADAPRRLVIKWRNEWKPEFNAEGYSRCTLELEPIDEVVKLSIIHEIDKANSLLINEGVSNGWPKIISNLKSLLETGSVVMPLKP
jgi:uncharacterized protein YndB with AHSA1/START domain